MTADSHTPRTDALEAKHPTLKTPDRTQAETDLLALCRELEEEVRELEAVDEELETIIPDTEQLLRIYKDRAEYWRKRTTVREGRLLAMKRWVRANLMDRRSP